MGRWTDEYRESRLEAFDELDQAAESAAASKQRKRDVRGVGIAHLHYLDDQHQRRVMHLSTEVIRSGLHRTERSHFSQDRTRPQAEVAKKDAEVGIASDLRKAVVG